MDVTATQVNKIFKAYDVRGLCPEELSEAVAYRVGAAFAALIATDAVLVGQDMRPTSPGLVAAFAAGAASQGIDVIQIGLCSTDGLYFASGKLNLPGVMFTASHNPAAYNGIKMCRAGAKPIGADTGLLEIRDAVIANRFTTAATPGQISTNEMLASYAAYLLELVPVTGRRLKVVVDAGNGMAGLTAPAVFAQLDVDLIPMYFDLDGTFPNHEANPIDPETLKDLQQRVIAEKADIGLAFDGDADRCFLVSEAGELISPSTLTGLIAARELAKTPGATIIHNLITSRAVPELVSKLGGAAVRTKVGHSYIKAEMATTGAIFGGEHSGHFYFSDFWGADSGMLAALHALAALAEQELPVSQLLAAYDRYFVSGEINSTVADQQAKMAEIAAGWGDYPEVELDYLDGLTVSHPDWWFNVRASNTEPLLRLNVEANTATKLTELRDQVLNQIRG